MSEITERLVKRANELGLTQTDLIKGSNAGKSTVFKWFNHLNDPSAKYLDNVASTLKVSTSWLLTGKDEAKSQSGDLTYREVPSSSSSLIVLMDNLKDMETNGELSPQVIAAINGVIDAVKSASQATNSEAKKTQPIDFKALQTEAVTNHGKD